jgi:hypothetical protein
VLDGATRTTALLKLGFRDVLAQVVDYYSNSITLETWHHLMPDQNGRKAMESIAAGQELSFAYCRQDEADRLLRRREILCYFIFFDNTCMTISDKNGRPSEHMKKLRNLVFAYDRNFPVTRIHFSDIGKALRKQGLVYMANIFPAFSKEELVRMAQSGLTLPAGISRHVVPGRVLGFQVKNSLLKTSRISLQKKNELIQKIYQEKIVDGQVRYYPESIYIFNEY